MKTNSIKPFTNALSRYIDNRVLGACIRPQIPKWCGPTTVSEILQILCKVVICPHEIALTMNWSSHREEREKGMGTTAVLRAVSVLSKNKLSYEKYDLLSMGEEKTWDQIKKAILAGDVIYLHEKGHHVLVSGFIEEPAFDIKDFEAGVSCNITVGNNKRCDGANTSAPVLIKGKRRYVILAEHNVKGYEKKDFTLGSLLRERNFADVFREISGNSDRFHLVRIFVQSHQTRS
jgi:hypothetical protein